MPEVVAMQFKNTQVWLLKLGLSKPFTSHGLVVILAVFKRALNTRSGAVLAHV